MAIKRDHIAASKAMRSTLLAAHADGGLKPFDLRVLHAVFCYLAGFSKLQDTVLIQDLAACVYAVDPSNLARWQRMKVGESLRKLDKRGLITYSANKGRPTLDQGGQRAVVAIKEIKHPLSKVLFSRKKALALEGALPEKSTLSGRVSDRKSTLSPREKHPGAPPENSSTVEGSVEIYSVEGLRCPRCAAGVHANHDDIKSGRHRKRPYFKCKNKACGVASWNDSWEVARDEMARSTPKTAPALGQPPVWTDLCGQCGSALRSPTEEHECVLESRVS